MKHALQALLIAPEQRMREMVHSGHKEITIREGHRDYKPGLTMLCCEKVPWAVMVDITSVRHCLAHEVTPDEYESDGFTSIKDMCTQMKRFYPDFKQTSQVTIIRWTNARGFFVDYPDEYGVYHDSVMSILGN
ncbi:ASCH domain-containing protein [Candidatus Kaiserbacteria bacterium]|nr:ASCH domain-containing protein [Candidatus Kaiserbacteria bacterium]